MELRYMGFEQTSTSRAYSFESIAAGRPPARYVVRVEMALFLKHSIGIQEGPSLCARKLSAGPEGELAAEQQLTNEDLQRFAGERAAESARRTEARRPPTNRRKPEAFNSPWRG